MASEPLLCMESSGSGRDIAEAMSQENVEAIALGGASG
jgi:hypothetical protein